MQLPDLNVIRAAAQRIAPFAHRTPVLTSRYFNQRTGSDVFFKCENFQRVGAFKFRGATNAVQSLGDDEARRGVVTHSSGNHAQALALAARQRGIPATIVMPRGAPAVKRNAVADYGAEIVECEPTQAARESAAEEIVARTGANFIHPYEDPCVVAGAATASLELIEEVPRLDVVVTPVGGGGLASGTCLAVSELLPQAKIIGAEPALADDARRSLAAGHIVAEPIGPTIADGLRTSLGPLTFSILSRHLREILTVDEAEIVQAMKLVWERMKIVIEPSSAVPVAALLKYSDRFRGRRVGVILSGGNVDLDCLPWTIR
ncbi:MAG: pyridoxal-phosphate dependent enzyme [Pirellulales bacterium]|nr:pyridoxal-phosphate dependent enzyme [Pirellulales bacterium]